MSKRCKLGFLVIVAVLMGCATGPMVRDVIEEIPNIAAGKGRIFVYKRSNPLTAFFWRTFTLDGSEVSDIFNGTSFFYDTSPGPHYVTFNNPKSIVKFNVPEGGSVYLKYTIVAATNANQSTNVKIVPKIQAEQEMAGTMLID